MAAIHQFVAGFARSDAISNEAIVLRRIFRSWGYESEIFCTPSGIMKELRREGRDVGEYSAACSPDDIVLLHLSIGSDVNDIFAGLPCRKAILYHNITPPHYVAPVQRQMARNLERGREQAARLATSADVTMADSLFNAGELQEMGYTKVGHLPLVLDLERLESSVDRAIRARLADGLVNVLFVGRCVPNKKLEDLLFAFACFQSDIEPCSRFIHVGSFNGLERYYYSLFALSRDLKLRNVVFTGSVCQSYLNAYYSSAHLFLCMSEHEGFCVPIIESMVHDVPIMAHAAAAVPETLDGAGVLFHEKNFEMIAETMARLVRDRELREAVLARQRERLQRYKSQDLEKELRRLMAPLLPA